MALAILYPNSTIQVEGIHMTGCCAVPQRIVCGDTAITPQCYAAFRMMPHTLPLVADCLFVVDFFFTVFSVNRDYFHKQD
jgi:hypothetical protein